MHFYSFDLRDPVFEIDGWNLSFQVITLENVYGLDPSRTTITETDNRHAISCDQLRWAGGKQIAPGHVTIDVARENSALRISVRASIDQPIRAIKILARDLPEVQILDQLDQPRPVPDGGLLERYPNGFRLPVFFARLPNGETLGFRCEDAAFCAKRFTAYRQQPGDRYTAECIVEEDARYFDTGFHAPDWVLGRDVDVEAFRRDQLEYHEDFLGLRAWEQRDDLPEWARDLRLALTLHGMHWSGYTFNTYDQMREIIEFAAARIDGWHILAYLPGWEGRYYWQYGDYRPEPMLGGVEGFRRLCDRARELGVHLMPMFGANCANAWAGNFHRFGPGSYMKYPTRNVFHGNQPDWDLSRAHDTGWQAWLNPGAPAWQNELVRQITHLIEQFDFDAVFLDTVEVWVNDPDFNLREGYRDLVDRLRGGRPDLLIAGEDWWDGLLDIFPMYQRSGAWRQMPDWVGRYARIFGHICDGDPSRGSTGVFESGYSPYARLPDLPHYLPTLAFVDGTLHNAREEVEAVIARAAANSRQQSKA
jgi:hypothetical protein